MRSRGALLVTISCIVAFAPAEARAEAETEPIRIEYDAVPGCPSAREFQRQVFQRAARARLAGESESARVFSIELKREAGEIVGSLVIHERDGATIARRVSGRSCGDVAAVLALASALAIDPRAELAAGQRLESDEPNTEEGKPLPTPAARPGDGSENDPPEPAERDGQYRALGFSLGPRAAYGTGPGVALGGSVAVLTQPQSKRAALGVELALLQASSDRVEGATADVRFLVARPRFCPFRFDLGPSVDLLSCLVAETGMIMGQGSDIERPASSDRFWLSLELPVRIDVPLSERWFVALEAGPGFPITRYRLVFETPETTIHPIAPVTASGALHIGVRL